MQGPNFPSRLSIESQQWEIAIDREVARLRVALPGIVQSFDPATQTVKVQLAIKETVKVNGVPTPKSIPILGEVPVVFPRAGGFTLTFPIKPGDECLVVFSDLCIDSWWQSGGVQNRMSGRRHDFSDGFAIIGPWSQPRVLSNYSEDNVQLRTDDGKAYIEVTPDWKVNIVAPGDVNVTTKNVNVEASGNVKVDVSGKADITVTGETTLTAADVKIIAAGGVTIIGNTLITGKLQATLGLTSGLGGIDQVEFQTHKHYLPSGDEQTLEPVPGT